MNKTTRNILIMIIIILLIFAIIFVWYQKFKTEPLDTNTVSGNILNDANTGLDNILDNILDNKNIENTNNVENTQNKQENTNKEQENDTDLENQMTSKESKAINLVKEQWKKEWGNLDDVSFNVSVRSDGKYLVTVYDITSTQLIQGYIVDVETETIKEK